MKTDYQPFLSATVSQCSRVTRKDTGSPCKSLMETDSVKRAAECSVKPKHIDSGQDTQYKNRSPNPGKAGERQVLTHTPRGNSKDVNSGGVESRGTRSVTPRSRRKARKPKKPQKSAACWDPNFRGVTMWFTTLVEGDRAQLRISSFFSKTTGKKKSFMGTKCRRKRSDSVSECKSSSDNEDFRETFPTMNFGGGGPRPQEKTTGDQRWTDHRNTGPQDHGIHKTKNGTDQRHWTNMWTTHVETKDHRNDHRTMEDTKRDHMKEERPQDHETMEDKEHDHGHRPWTIYRKYRVRCSKCWHIPKKDSKTYPSCSVCGGMLRFHQNRKLW
ncbi:uncharacterized protein LOC124286474 [Haliotis rubra]|uniref:uncharacterized protein LOC124286474 n=1 Tax=Haliotis rubra TaxID=36100 RepID=UPI001EE62964|nr:uncharacterized protein LOC124286474 [Haliotis rubra]